MPSRRGRGRRRGPVPAAGSGWPLPRLLLLLLAVAAAAAGPAGGAGGGGGGPGRRRRRPRLQAGACLPERVAAAGGAGARVTVVGQGFGAGSPVFCRAGGRGAVRADPESAEAVVCGLPGLADGFHSVELSRNGVDFTRDTEAVFAVFSPAVAGLSPGTAVAGRPATLAVFGSGLAPGGRCAVRGGAGGGAGAGEAAGEVAAAFVSSALVRCHVHVPMGGEPVQLGLAYAGSGPVGALEVVAVPEAPVHDVDHGGGEHVTARVGGADADGYACHFGTTRVRAVRAGEGQVRCWGGDFARRGGAFRLEHHGTPVYAAGLDAEGGMDLQAAVPGTLFAEEVSRLTLLGARLSAEGAFCALGRGLYEASPGGEGGEAVRCDGVGRAPGFVALGLRAADGSPLSNEILVNVQERPRLGRVQPALVQAGAPAVLGVVGSGLRPGLECLVGARAAALVVVSSAYGRCEVRLEGTAVVQLAAAAAGGGAVLDDGHGTELPAPGAADPFSGGAAETVEGQAPVFRLAQLPDAPLLLAFGTVVVEVGPSAPLDVVAPDLAPGAYEVAARLAPSQPRIASAAYAVRAAAASALVVEPEVGLVGGAPAAVEVHAAPLAPAPAFLALDERCSPRAAGGGFDCAVGARPPGFHALDVQGIGGHQLHFRTPPAPTQRVAAGFRGAPVLVRVEGAHLRGPCLHRGGAVPTAFVSSALVACEIQPGGGDREVVRVAGAAPGGGTAVDVHDRPTVEELHPPAVAEDGGAPVTLRGPGLREDLDLRCGFGAVRPVASRGADDGRAVECVAVARAPGEVAVTVGGVGPAHRGRGQALAVRAAPAVAGAWPEGAVEGAAGTVTLFGEGAGHAPGCSVGGEPGLPGSGPAGADALRCDHAALAAGFAEVGLAGGPSVRDGAFQVQEAPSVRGAGQAAGWVGEGLLVHVVGHNLVGAACSVGGVGGAPGAFVSSALVVCEATWGLEEEIRVQVAGAASGAPVTFAPRAHVAAASPDTCTEDGGRVVEIAAAHLDGVSVGTVQTSVVPKDGGALALVAPATYPGPKMLLARLASGPRAFAGAYLAVLPALTVAGSVPSPTAHAVTVHLRAPVPYLADVACLLDGGALPARADPGGGAVACNLAGAGTGFAVVQLGAHGATSAPVQVERRADPILHHVWPATFPPAGDLPATLTGANLDRLRFCEVKGGGRGAAIPVSSAVAYCVVPAAAGAGQAEELAANGGGTLPVVYAAPEARSLHPATGPARGGTRVQVATAAGAAPQHCKVRFGAVSDVAAREVDAGALEFATPAHRPGAVEVAVALGGLHHRGRALAFEVAAEAGRFAEAAAVVRTVVPGGGLGATEPPSVAIRGLPVPASGAVTCRFGPILREAVPDGAGGVRCPVPFLQEGFQTLTVAAEAVDLLPQALQFEFRPSATLDAATPAHVAASGGTLVRLTGSEFDAESPGCVFGNRTVPATFVSSSLLICEAQVGRPVASLPVAPAAGRAARPSGEVVHLAASGLPVVSGLHPTVGPPHGGTVLTVGGRHFAQRDDMYCAFGTVAVRATFVSETQMLCASPSRSGAGVEVGIRGGFADGIGAGGGQRFRYVSL